MYKYITRRLECIAKFHFFLIRSPKCIIICHGYFSAMMADILMARSRMDRCSSAPSNSRLSISEKTRTILFFCTSGIVSSNVMTW